MRIVVCIKQVPDTNQMRFDKDTYSLIRDGVPFIINPFDENAIEAGLQIKEQHGGEVIVISMGPPQVAESLRHAIAMVRIEQYFLVIGVLRLRIRLRLRIHLPLQLKRSVITISYYLESSPLTVTQPKLDQV